jgi:hypothetical protein
MRLLQQKGWSFFLRRTWDPWFCSHLFFKVMQMKHEPHGDFYIIVCYYCCSPCNWNFLHSFVCSYTVLWTKGIYKTPNIFFLSQDAYNAEYCRWTHYLVTNVYRLHTPFLYETMSFSHCNPVRVRGGRVELALLKGTRFILCLWNRWKIYSV